LAWRGCTGTGKESKDQDSNHVQNRRLTRQTNNAVIHFPGSRACIERTVPALQILVVHSTVTSESFVW